MSRAAEKAAGAQAGTGVVSLALGMIKNPGLRSYVSEQLCAARTPKDRAAALAILMESVGRPCCGSGHRLH